MRTPTVKRTGMTTLGISGILISNCALIVPAVAFRVHCQLMNASLGDAVNGYTMNAAYASFEEDVKGSIEVDKFADKTISYDLFRTRTDDTAREDPLLTIVGREDVRRYDRFPGEHARMRHAESRWPIR
jgi:hypothetical protein